MSKNTLWLIIGLMAISLLGLLSFQVYWIQQSIQQKEADLEKDIQKALASLEESIEDEEAMIFVKDGRHLRKNSFTNEKGSFSYVTDVRIENNSDSVLKEIDRTYQFIADDGFQGGVMIMDDNISEIDVIRIRDSVKSQVQLIQRFNEKKIELTEAIDKIAVEFAFKEQDFTDRMRSLDFDSLINQAFTKEGLSNLNFDYTLKDLSNDSIVESKKTLQETNIETSLYEKELLNRDYQSGGILNLYIVDRYSYVLESIWPILIVSLLLSLLLIFTFYFTLQKIIKQKKLSEMKSDFINNMTHEFKTPIATISLAIDSIFHPDVFGKKTELKRYGSIIKKENERMHQQVERLLQTAVFEKGKAEFKLENVHLHKILEELKSIYELSSSEEKEISIELDLNANSDLVEGDPMHLFNAFRNIIDNAVKFSTKKADISIRTSTSSGWLKVSIEDEGIGMSKQTQKHIFDSFYRYTEKDIHTTKGFGLGLSYVKDVIERSWGKIHVDSQLHKGSTFIVELKLKNEKQS